MFPTTFPVRHAAPIRRAMGSAAALALAVFALACGSGSTAPPEPAPVVHQIVVQPGLSSAYVGSQVTFAAHAFDQNGQEIVGRSVAWSSSDTSVAKVSLTGVVAAIGKGSTFIRAEVAGKSASGRLEVLQVPVASVEVSPEAVTLAEGTSRQLQAVARDSVGGVLEGRAVSWTTMDATVVSVDASGRITAVGVGRADVRAAIEGREALVDVTVTASPPASVAVSPSGVVVEVGEHRQLTAVVKDALGRDLSGRPIQWSVDNANASISPSGLLTGLRHGYITITATSEGVSGSVGGTIVEADPVDYDLLYHRVKNGESELFTLSLAGGSTPLRLNAGTVSRTPTPSPDGLRVAFAVSMQDLGTGQPVDDIFAVDRNGMNMKRLTTAPGVDDAPDWSPTGQQIAYRHWDVGGRADIWVMNPDGSGQVNLTADMSDGGFRSEPAWSRDGQRIAFAQSESGPAGTTATIWTMRADGSDKRMVTSTLSGFDASPAWSPDGTRIAFTRYYGGEADITIVEVVSGVLSRLPLPGLESTPAWSPDGSLIAFTLNGAALYTMQPDGSRLRLRTVDASWGGGLAPVWITRP